MMDKPTKKHVSEPVYNWNACKDYIEQKYSITLRDYYGKFKKENINDDVEYYDFWHVITEHFDISNGCFIAFYESDIESIESYSTVDKIIFTMFFTEFGDGEMGERDCSFWVDW